MTKNISFFIFCVVLNSVGLYAQIHIHLASAQNTSLNVYSYYPEDAQKQFPLKQVNVTAGRGTLETNTLKPGIYSIYPSNTQNTYVNILINTSNNNFELFWDTKTGFKYFKNSPVNQQLFDIEKQYYPLNTERKQLKRVIQNFEEPGLLSQSKQRLKEVENEITTLLKPTTTTPTALDDYLVAIDLLDTGAKTEEEFWNSVQTKDALLWSTRYHYTVFEQWKALANNQSELKTEQEKENFFIKGIIKHLGKQKAMHPFLTDWLSYNYNKNQLNDVYIESLQELLKLPNASEDQKLLWQTHLETYQPLSIGEAIDLKVLEEKQYLEPNNKSISLVFYSEGCKACVDLLEQVNDLPYKVVAVRVYSSKNSLVNPDLYPNVSFYLPEDPTIYEKYVVRGTPSLYYLEKEEEQWLIKAVK